MAPPGSELDINIAGFAARLLEVPETAARARLTAQAILQQIPSTTTTIYLLEGDDDGPFWSVRATAGENVEPDPTVPAEAGTLGTVFQDPRPVVFEGNTLVARGLRPSQCPANREESRLPAAAARRDAKGSNRDPEL